MLFEMDKEDLITLIKGSSPNYSIMNSEIIKENGFYSPYHGWQWHYSTNFDKYGERELYSLYKMIKESWK